MKTFESEFEELKKWILEKNEELDKEMESAPVRGRDSEIGYQRHGDVLEYNRRLRELKKKYNRE